MTTRELWSRILIFAGGIAMLLGPVDPLEGSLLILPGSGMIALGLSVGKAERRLLRYWVWVFILIAVGVGALFTTCGDHFSASSGSCALIGRAPAAPCQAWF